MFVCESSPKLSFPAEERLGGIVETFKTILGIRDQLGRNFTFLTIPVAFGTCGKSGISSGTFKMII